MTIKLLNYLVDFVIFIFYISLFKGHETNFKDTLKILATNIKLKLK